MKLTPNASLITSLRGSVGRLRFSETPAGHVARRPWTIRAPASNAQTTHRQAVADVRTLWLSVPTSLEVAWQTYAQQVPYSAYAAWVHYNLGPVRDDQLTVLTPPNATYAPVADRAIVAGADGEIDATWTYPGPAATVTCWLYYRLPSTLSWQLGASCDAADLADTITGLAHGVTYEVALTASTVALDAYQQSSHAFCPAGGILYEDFDSSTELDPAGVSAPAGPLVEVGLLTRDSDAWLCKDKGPGHFAAAFAHDFELVVSLMAGSSAANCWSLSNIVQNDAYWSVNSSQALTVGIRVGPGDARLWLWNRESGASDLYDPINYDQRYYCTAERTTPTTLDLRIYSDAARLTLLDTLQVAVNAARSYRYVFAVVSYTDPAGVHMSFDFANLALNES